MVPITSPAWRPFLESQATEIVTLLNEPQYGGGEDAE